MLDNHHVHRIEVHVLNEGQITLNGDELDDCKLQIGDVFFQETVSIFIHLLKYNSLLTARGCEFLGNCLHSTLFNNKIGEKLIAALEKEENEFVRLELKFGSLASKYASWPWEYTCFPIKGDDGRTGIFFVEQAKLVLTRLITRQADKRENNFQVEKQLRILVIISNPIDLPQFPIDSIEQDFNKLKNKNTQKIDIKIITPKDKKNKNNVLATYNNFINFREIYGLFPDLSSGWNPHVIHFVGHGKFEIKDEKTTGSIAFMDESSGEKNWIDDQDFANVLKQSFPETRLVFLQACESSQSGSQSGISGMAQHIAHRLIPAVVGMQYPVQNIIAKKFAYEFYAALINSQSVDKAVQLARLKLHGSWRKNSAFGLPVLYMHKNVVGKELLVRTPEPASDLSGFESTRDKGQSPLPIGPVETTSNGQKSSEITVDIPKKAQYEEYEEYEDFKKWRELNRSQASQTQTESPAVTAARTQTQPESPAITAVTLGLRSGLTADENLGGNKTHDS